MANGYNLGLDLGTSNTVCSYVGEDGKLENFKFLDGEQTPSIVFCKNNKTQIGYQARRKYDLTRGQGLYRSYKMHTYIKDKEELERLNYTDMTPSEVMEKFLLAYVGAFVKEKKVEKANRIVVGAPETFFRSEHGTDMRTELKRILDRCNLADKVRIVSEPTAAAVYYLHLNERTRSECNLPEDSGSTDYILVVDCGGGTVDLNICAHQIKNGKRSIHVVSRSGAGEHHENKEESLDAELGIQSNSYGRSGIFYLEEVLLAAIQKQYPEMEEIEEDNEFKKAFMLLEDYLKNPPIDDSDEISMEEYFSEKISGFDEEFLEEHKNDGFEIEYDDDDLFITYDLMYEVYERTFKKVLEHELNSICEDTARQMLDIPYNRTDDGKPGDNTFRIVMVGGFSSFPLVRNQVEAYFHKLPVNDIRFKTIGVKAASLAVANGLALLANGDMEFNMRAPYGVSVVGSLAENVERAFIGVKYGDFLNLTEDEEQPFFAHAGQLKTKEERRDARKIFVGDELQYMGYDNGSSVGIVKRKVSQQLKDRVVQVIRKHITADGNEPFFHIGFSFDESSQLYIHVVEYDGKWADRIGPLKFEEIFDRQIGTVEVVEAI